MATIYPKPLPCYVENDPKRAAECRLYEALESSLTDSYAVFYGVAWLAKSAKGGARDGEVDFVVAHPDRGVLLLEVKGGEIYRDQATGRWTSVDRGGHPHSIHDPFDQVRASKHALIDKLHEHPVLGHERVAVGHGVVLPDCANPHRALTPDALPEITVFAEDMPRIGERVAHMLRYWSGQLAPGVRPGSKFVAALTDLLAPNFELRQPLCAAVAEEDRELLRLTEQQFHLLDFLNRQRRVSITGGAGTGKTVLALEKAKRLAREGFKVLLTCFNRPLADHLRRSAGSIDGLTILSFHQLCWHFAKQAGIALPDPGAAAPPPDFFPVILPNAMLEALERVPDRFDAIVVDEGQDFLESWWTPLQFSLADPGAGVLYVFHDNNQRVYRRVPSFPANLVEFSLNHNLRNTQRIHAVTSRFYCGQPLEAIGPEGREVECVGVASPVDLEEAVGKVLHRLTVNEHVRAADIAVLVGSSHAWAAGLGPRIEVRGLRIDGSQAHRIDDRGAGRDRIGTVAVTGDQFAEPDKVLVETVRRFKGLERPVIVLTGIDDLSPEDEKSLLYVGLSRARVYLVVVATAATLDRIGLAPNCLS